MCNELCEVLFSLVFVFFEMLYFMSEEFSLVDCYLVLLLWCLFVLGIELIGNGSKDIYVYMNCIFVCSLFKVLLID